MWFNFQLLLFGTLYSIITLLANTHTNEISEVKISSNKSSRTTDQISAINQLRNLASKIISTHEFYASDSFLIHWLQARDFDVAATNQMLTDAFKWREENQIDSIVKENLSDFTFPPVIFQGYDKEGHPIALVTLKEVDVRKSMINGQRAKLLRYFDQMLELGLNKVKREEKYLQNGERITQFVIIMDFSGLNIRQHMCFQCLPFHLDSVYHFENYYPGAVKYFVMINMNRMALTLIETLRPMMSVGTRNALRCFETNKAEWSKFLLSIINPDQLSPQFGGTMVSRSAV